MLSTLNDCVWDLILDLLTTIALFIILNCPFFIKFFNNGIKGNHVLCSPWNLFKQSLLSGQSSCVLYKVGSEDFYGPFETPEYLTNNLNMNSHVFLVDVCLEMGAITLPV